jgi:hypothetical protein
LLNLLINELKIWECLGLSQIRLFGALKFKRSVVEFRRFPHPVFQPFEAVRFRAPPGVISIYSSNLNRVPTMLEHPPVPI